MIVSWWQLCRQWSKVLTRGVGRSSDQKTAEALHTGICTTQRSCATGGRPQSTSPRWCPATSSSCAWASSRFPGDFFIAWREALGYLLLIELGKRAFDGAIPATTRPVRKRADDGRRFLRRRAAHRGGADGLS